MAVQPGFGMRFDSLSRRSLLAGAGSVALGAVYHGFASAQPVETAADGFRIVRAQNGVEGPTLYARRGDDMRIRLVNGLDEPTALHWHGVRIDNAMDGAPGLTQAPVEPGASFDYRFKVPDAGTFWFHPPFLPGGKPKKGPSGALLVAEPDPLPVDQDILLFLPESPATAVRDIPVRTNQRLRLRVINAASWRMQALRIERHPARVMAVDGQPAEPFLARDSRVVLAPGNRTDLFVDAILVAGETASILVATESGETAVARLVYAAGAPERPAVLADPKPLPANALPATMNFPAALRPDLVLADGAPAKPSAPQPLFRAARGRTVVMALINRTAQPAVAHIHGHHFRLLDKLDDGWKPFWLDTTVVLPRDTLRIAFVADNRGKWAVEFREIKPNNNMIERYFEVM